MAQAPTAPAADLSALLSQRARNLPGTPQMVNDGKAVERISFSYGFPDPASLPADEVAAATTSILARAGDRALQYGTATGVPDLIDVLLAKLKRDQGIDAGPENVLITAGASQALGLVLDAFVDWGDPVITEEPTWMGAVRAFGNVGAEPVPVPVDDQGTDVDALGRQLAWLREAGTPAKLVYVITNFQNPSGISTTLERRRRIVELAHEHGTLILEDDAYYDLRYDGDGIPPIYTLDDRSQTLYMGTFSKIMGAGMRLGWVVGAPEIINKLAVLKIDGGTNIFGSYVAAEWVPGHLERHVDRLRAIYRRRRDLMLDALERHMPAGTTWTRPDGGFFLWVTLPQGLDAAQLAIQARERGVEFLPGRTCFVGDRGQNTLRLSYSFAQDGQIEPGIRVIAEIVKGELLESGRPM